MITMITKIFSPLTSSVSSLQYEARSLHAYRISFVEARAQTSDAARHSLREALVRHVNDLYREIQRDCRINNIPFVVSLHLLFMLPSYSGAE